MLSDILAHKFTDDLSCGAILRATYLYELFSEVALHTDTKPGIFPRHFRSVSNVFTPEKEKPERVQWFLVRASKDGPWSGFSNEMLTPIQNGVSLVVGIGSRKT